MFVPYVVKKEKKGNTGTKEYTRNVNAESKSEKHYVDDSMILACDIVIGNIMGNKNDKSKTEIISVSGERDNDAVRLDPKNWRR